VHGKPSTYINHACRCVPCTQAAAFVLDVEGQQTPSRAEDGAAVSRVITGRHHGRVPGRLHEFQHPGQQRIESLTGQATELV